MSHYVQTPSRFLTAVNCARCSVISSMFAVSSYNLPWKKLIHILLGTSNISFLLGYNILLLYVELKTGGQIMN